MYGYDAGVLGGVQTTKAYLDALGVRRTPSHSLTLANRMHRIRLGHT
jgi:hypothetical protein